MDEHDKPKVYILEPIPVPVELFPFVSKAVGVPLAKIAAELMMGQKLRDFGLKDEVKISHVAVKESIFPFIKLPEADSVLGPEMKSTGESMGSIQTLESHITKPSYLQVWNCPQRGQFSSVSVILIKTKSPTL
jgi:carbamoyl-phosphate synthase large subunit